MKQRLLPSRYQRLLKTLQLIPDHCCLSSHIFHPMSHIMSCLSAPSPLLRLTLKYLPSKNNYLAFRSSLDLSSSYLRCTCSPLVLKSFPQKQLSAQNTDSQKTSSQNTIYNTFEPHLPNLATWMPFQQFFMLV